LGGDIDLRLELINQIQPGIADPFRATQTGIGQIGGDVGLPAGHAHRLAAARPAQAANALGGGIERHIQIAVKRDLAMWHREAERVTRPLGQVSRFFRRRPGRQDLRQRRPRRDMRQHQLGLDIGALVRGAHCRGQGGDLGTQLAQLGAHLGHLGGLRRGPVDVTWR